MWRSRLTVWLVVLAVLLAGAVLPVSPAYEQYEAWQAECIYRTGNADARRNAVRWLGRLATVRSQRVVNEALSDPEPMVRTAAAYAVFVGKFRALEDALWAAIQRESDSRVRASMIGDWTLATGQAARPHLQDLAESRDPYDRFAAASGLLRLGNPEAAEWMFTFAAEADRFGRRAAQRELYSLAAPMGYMVGQPVPVPNPRQTPWSRQDLNRLRNWWQTRVTPRLLNDHLAWRYNRPYYWKRAGTLLHEWQKRMPGFLRTVDEEAD